MGVPLEAVCQVAAWKNPELKGYLCALVKTGLELQARQVPYFGSDDVPEVDQPRSPAVSGIAIKVLKSAGLIQNYTGVHPEAGVFYGRRSSRHKAAHGREIHLYQITNRIMAENFLKRHSVPAPVLQLSLF